MSSRSIGIVMLIIICLASLALAYPTINNNISAPNMVHYFNSDEGMLMDLAWSYYGSQKRMTQEMTLDYGIEYVYIGDILKVISSRSKLTIGTLLLIIRWFHFIAWLAAIVSLWFLVKVHFGSEWKAILAALLLAVRPAFDHCLSTLKPEPLVLLFIIWGLYYSLKIVESAADRRYLMLAVAFASAAFITKFAGVFIVPAIVMALYLGYMYSGIGYLDKSAILYRISWTAPIIAALPVIAAPFLGIFSYIRKTNGLTYFQELGFVDSILKYKIFVLFWLVGAVLIVFSLTLYILNRQKSPRIKKVMHEINKINCFVIMAIAYFALFVGIFGFKWIFIPQHFLACYGVNSLIFTGGEAIVNAGAPGNLLGLFIKHIAIKVSAFDPLILFLLLVYFFAEIACHIGRARRNDINYYKRIVLVVYLIPCLVSVFSIFGAGRLARHNMLPFFVAGAVLSIEGLGIVGKELKLSNVWKRSLAALIALVFVVDIYASGSELIRERIGKYCQSDDIVYEIAKWWRVNIPVDARVVSDHFRYVYVPEEYKNVKLFKRGGGDSEVRFRHLIEFYKPRYIFINENIKDAEKPIQVMNILPRVAVSIYKVFDSSGLPHQRWPGARFVIYKVSYDHV